MLHYKFITLKKTDSMNNDPKKLEHDASPLHMGVRLLEGAEANTVDLGPLTELKGTWEGQPFDGWNVIAVPGPRSNGGPGGFILEIIPYKETLTFKPVVQAGNRGIINDFKQSEQQITGLVYGQRITSVCDRGNCAEMGFPAGTEIHVETGILLYIKDCIKIQDKNDTTCVVSPYNIARLATIPHGNSVLALGTSVTGTPPNNDFFGKASTLPTPVDNNESFQFGYSDAYKVPEPLRLFPQFNQQDPNTFLSDMLNKNKEKIKSMTTINMSSKNLTGGILNIPFSATGIKTIDMHATFYIQHIEGSDTPQLQYTQTINLDFPGMNLKAKPIPVIWPHVTVDTLKRVSTE
jgi:hypothetical protein